jgi:predicted enzyme related to lactoylglutathione lyase
MHRILLREVIVDVPTADLPRVAAFWAGALGSTARRLEDHPEFWALPGAAALPHVGLQDIGTEPPRYHLDIESDDVEAEVTRLVALGATEVSRQPSWVVLADPAGLLLCVLPPECEEFADRSRLVG